MITTIFLHLCLAQQGLSITLPQWSVPASEGIDDYCLLASGNFSLLFPPLQDNLLSLPGNNTWVVPSNASAQVWKIFKSFLCVRGAWQGGCGDQASELNLHWRDPVTDEENLLNIVIIKMDRLAGITGVFVRLHTGPDERGMKEMSGQYEFADINTLVWPIRYADTVLPKYFHFMDITIPGTG